MSSLRFSIVVLLLWLAGLYNIERLHEPINLASFVYVLTAVLAAVIISIEKIGKLLWVEIAIVTVVAYASLKWLLGYQFFGSNLPITVTECVVLAVTNFLAWRVADRITVFRENARELAIVEWGHRLPPDFAEVEPLMYREVQRARRFHSPLILATVACETPSEDSELERLDRKTRFDVVRRYVASEFGSQLLKSTQPADLVATRNGQFILLFPQTDAQQVSGLVQEVASRQGVRVQMGTAAFPDEECTLSGLIERSQAELRSLDFELEQEPPTALREMDDREVNPVH